MMTGQIAPVRDLLLVGGGHAHVQVLRRFGMQPVPGVRVTVIAREPNTPYSGMLPGYVAGHYTFDQIHIDLGPLCRFAGARFIADAVVGLDLEAQSVTLAEQPGLRFDALSLNIGATPAALGQTSDVTAVKPIGQFLPQWQRTLERLADRERILLLGAGAGAVELAIAMRTVVPASVGVGLVGQTLLPGYNDAARRRIRSELAERKIGLLESDPVVNISGDTAVTAAGQRLVAEHFFDVTGVQAPSWLGETGLLLDERGFVRVDAHLRSLSHPAIFAAGDIAHLEGQPRPKSGVYAVRAGPVLAANLARLWTDRPLQRYRAQRSSLALLGTGNGQALAVRGPFALHGAWADKLKHYIDQKFMDRFQKLPDMTAEGAPHQLREEVAAALPDPMRCGGCGGKLAAGPLARVLARLPVQAHPDLLLGIGDDAARLRLDASAGGQLLLTVDGISQFIADPYRFARIATHHAINDILAMGGKPIAALALATVPVMSEALTEQDLYLLLKGVVEVLAEHGAVLAGGHSAEGADMALGLTVTGYPGARPLEKQSLQPGQRLILTKALGTGALLAADMRGQLPSTHLLTAVAAMDQSNAAALTELLAHGATAATDITGFGLLGHLAEMLDGMAYGVRIELDAVPLLPGALEVVGRGIRSSLQDSNQKVLSRYLHLDGVDSAAAIGLSPSAALQLLCDPQTSGGLLAAVPADQAAACVARLRSAGYAAAADIGAVTATGEWLLAQASEDQSL